MSLAPGNMFAEGNHVHHVGLWKRTYQPALFWAGVNNTYARNLLEDGPAMCIWGGGNVSAKQCPTATWFQGFSIVRLPVNAGCDFGLGRSGLHI